MKSIGDIMAQKTKKSPATNNLETNFEEDEYSGSLSSSRSVEKPNLADKSKFKNLQKPKDESLWKTGFLKSQDLASFKTKK